MVAVNSRLWQTKKKGRYLTQSARRPTPNDGLVYDKLTRRKPYKLAVTSYEKAEGILSRGGGETTSPTGPFFRWLKNEIPHPNDLDGVRVR